MRQEILYAVIFCAGILLGFIFSLIFRPNKKSKSDGTIYIQDGEDGREKLIWDFSGISEDELLKRDLLVVKVQNNLSKKMQSL